MSPSPEDKRYRDSLSPPCATLVVDNVPPDVSAEAITSIFSKVCVLVFSSPQGGGVGVAAWCLISVCVPALACGYHCMFFVRGTFGVW